MKRLMALVLAGLMVLGGVCLAAEWPEGRSAAQPYSHLPEVNLNETMGYIMMFPRAKLPVTRFCDVLGMYLPREDLALGEGLLHLYERVADEDEPVEVCAVDFSDPNSVLIREMSEKELSDLMWGGGTCVEMYLPKSLEFGDADHSYFVLMDPGCYTAAEGRLQSLQITSEEAWVPVISGDYGVSGLYYTDAKLPTEADLAPEEESLDDIIGEGGITDVVVAEPEGEAAEGKEAETSQDPAPSEEPGEAPAGEGDKSDDTADAGEGEDGEAAEDAVAYVTRPDVGDRVHFNLVLGGDAKLAVLYSDNGSVEFDEIEYDKSGLVEGTVVGDEVAWGVAFYDANDYIFDTIDVFGH